jgi:hypothetical protein
VVFVNRVRYPPLIHIRNVEGENAYLILVPLCCLH